MAIEKLTPGSDSRENWKKINEIIDVVTALSAMKIVPDAGNLQLGKDVAILDLRGFITKREALELFGGV